MLAHIQSVANHEGIRASVPTVGMASCNDCCELRLEQPTMPSHSRSPCCCIAVTRSSAVPSRISEYDRPTYGVRTRCDGHTRQLFRKRTRPPRTTNRQERSRGRKNFIRRLRERVPSIARYQRHQDLRGRILGSHRPHEARMSRQTPDAPVQLSARIMDLAELERCEVAG